MKLTKEDILHFLKVAYFGNIDNVYDAASKRAYRDFCRTIRSQRFKEASYESKEGFRQDVTDYMRTKIDGLKGITNKKQEVFDAWHTDVCNGIIDRFPYGIMYYGQAQKWINMTFKYLYVLEESVHRDAWYFPFLHIPMDNIIINVAVENQLIERPIVRWSRWTENQYKTYQTALKTAIHKSKGDDFPPLLWEFRNWKADEE